MTIYELILYFILVMFQIYCELVFLSSLFKPFSFKLFDSKKDIVIYVIILLISFPVLYLVKFTNILPWSFMIINQFFVFTGYYVFLFGRFKVRWYVPVIAVSIYWLVAILIEIPYGLLMIKIVNPDNLFAFWIQGLGAFYFGLMFLVFGWLFSKANLSIKVNTHIPKSISSYLVLTPIVMLVIYDGAAMDYKNSISIIVFILVFVVASMVFLSIWFEQQRNEMLIELLTNEVDDMSHYAKSVDELYKEVRNYKHDLNNILLGMRSAIDEGNIVEIKEAFYNDVVDNRNANNETYQFLNMIQSIELLPIKGLLLSKFEIIREKEISLKVDIQESFSNLDIDNVDLCRILGILFDNAIESAQLSNNKQIFFKAIREDKQLKIEVENSFDSPPDFSKMDKSGASTKGKGRGYGLESLNDIINRVTKLSMYRRVDRDLVSVSLVLS